MLDRRRPFKMAEASPPRRAAFGWGWLLLFVVFTAAATVLWTGIGADLLGRLRVAYGGMAKWFWLAGVFSAAVILPLMIPKSSSSSRLRAFQMSSVLLLALAVAGAVALQRAELFETARRGTRVAFSLFEATPAVAAPVAPVAPSPVASPPVAAAGATAPDDPEVHAVLSSLLTGENFRLDEVALVPTGYADSMTRASARATANASLSRNANLVDLAMAANVNVPWQIKALTPLKAQLDALALKLPGMGDREALEAVLVAQVAVTDALLVGDPKETPAKARAARDHANEQAAAARCQQRLEYVYCRVAKVDYVLEREDGRWRVDRAGGNDGIFPAPVAFIAPMRGGKTSARTGAKADGNELEQALYATEAVMRASRRIDLKRNLDPALGDLLTDDAAFDFLDGASFMMQLRLEKGVKPGDEYPADLKRFNQLTKENVADQDRLRCKSHDELRRLIEQWNQVVPVTATDEPENVMVETIVNPLTFSRVLPGEFDVLAVGRDGGASPTGQRVVLRDGKWKWWEPRRVNRECSTGPPADRPPPR